MPAVRWVHLARYGSVKKMLAVACDASGATHVSGSVPLPVRFGGRLARVWCQARPYMPRVCQGLAAPMTLAAPSCNHAGMASNPLPLLLPLPAPQRA